MKDNRDPNTLDPSRDRVRISTEDGFVVKDYTANPGAHVEIVETDNRANIKGTNNPLPERK